MKTLLTLDYEVYFGRQTGTVERCLIAPTRALVGVADRHGARLAFFVDAGFILRLREEMHRAAALRAQHDAVCRQVEALARAGHEIQLHVHPHWEGSRWTEAGWEIDVERFALHAFEPAAIDDIVARYARVLRELAGGEAAYAYRAGGWVIQPFSKLRPALLRHGVTIDSTVFAGGRSEGRVQPYDFRGAPAASKWRFDVDPLVEDPAGAFLELPIASRRLRPDFFWRFAAVKKLGGARHRAFGDGRAIAMEGGDLLRKLLRPTPSVVSLDGYKASFLEAAAADYASRGMEEFVVIGHPKALTSYSLERLDAFLAKGRDVVGYAQYRDWAPACAGATGGAGAQGRDAGAASMQEAA
jgi:peptidoglycan/xylan/chitin deacetylase (PgdA/CDA1 family)